MRPGVFKNVAAPFRDEDWRDRLSRLMRLSHRRALGFLKHDGLLNMSELTKGATPWGIGADSARCRAMSLTEKTAGVGPLARTGLEVRMEEVSTTSMAGGAMLCAMCIRYGGRISVSYPVEYS